MHGHRNIGPTSFPRQGRWLGRRVAVLFPRTRDAVAGELVRDDIDSPDIQIVRLDDGRLVVKGEWARLEVLPSGELEPTARVVALEFGGDMPVITTGLVPPDYFDTATENCR